MIEEVEDVFGEEDEEDEIPPTQLPDTNSKRRETRASSRQLPPPTTPPPPPPVAKPADKGLGAQAGVKLTQKRKDNISSSFLTSLSNKGISEELRKTKRYLLYMYIIKNVRRLAASKINAESL